MSNGRTMRLRRASVIAGLALLTSAATASAQNTWVLWRRFIPADELETHDLRLWRAQPGTMTKQQCESEVKEYRALDPDKQLHDSAGRGYRIEYHCLPDVIDPRGGEAEVSAQPSPNTLARGRPTRSTARRRG